MAQYSADIRVGITGKRDLDTLEKQLNRVNKSLNQINKGLKGQTLKINTKAATRSINALDKRLQKLNRTVKVNANITEKRRGGGGGGGGGGPALAINVTSAQVAAAKKTQRIAEALTNEEQKQLDLGKERNRQIQRLKDGFDSILEQRQKITKLAEQQRKLENAADNPKTGKNRVAAGMFGAGTNQAEGLKMVNSELGKARQNLDVLDSVQNDITKRVVDSSRAYGKFNANIKKGVELSEEQAAATAKQAKFMKSFATGAMAGGGIAASSALSGVPVLGGAATGALAGFFTGGGPAGAAGGAIAGGIADATTQLAGFGAQATKTATQITRLNKSLELAAGGDYAESLRVIRRVVDSFNTPLTDATEQFTKLFASAQGSGLELEELETLFVGLSAANKAFAGDTQDLNGILRAFTQIISKGTVQSEELKGQVGERLPGAFAMAAESLNMTTAELQKALEDGEVSSAEFVRKFGQYMLQFEEKAKTIADSPFEAGARLKNAMTDLENAVGGDLADLGADFQDLATIIVRDLIPVAEELISLAKAAKLALDPFVELGSKIGGAMSEAGVGFDDFVEQMLLGAPIIREVYLALKALKEIQDAFKPKQTAGLPSNYKQTELAAFAQAEKWRESQKPDPVDVGKAPEMQRELELAKEINKIEMSTLGISNDRSEILEVIKGIHIAELEYQSELKEIAASSLLDEEKKVAVLQAEEELTSKLIQLKKNELQIQRQKKVEEETRSLEQRVDLSNAYYNAELKIVDLDIQRAQNRNDIAKVYDLELKKAKLIYNQTILQIQAELENVAIKYRSVRLETQQLKTSLLLKQSKEGLNELDREAWRSQVETYQIARKNLEVQAAVADQQLRGANAVYMASTESSKYAYNQARVADEAERTAAAQQRAAVAMRAANRIVNSGGGGSGSGPDDTWLIEGKRYTFQGSKSSTTGGATIINKSHPFASTAPSHLYGASKPEGYAEGGFVTRPTNAMIGEAGEPEYVLPESKLDSAISRYARGTRGPAVVEGGGRKNSGGSSGGSVVNVNTGPVMRMNNKDYVTVSDMNNALGTVMSAMGGSGGNYGGSARVG